MDGIRIDPATLRATELVDRARQLPGSAPRDAAEAAEAGRRFEALFGGLLARELRRGLDGGFFGQGAGSDTFDAWFDRFLGDAFAEGGALGLARLVEANAPPSAEAGADGGEVAP